MLRNPSTNSNNINKTYNISTMKDLEILKNEELAVNTSINFNAVLEHPEAAQDTISVDFRKIFTKNRVVGRKLTIIITSRSSSKVDFTNFYYLHWPTHVYLDEKYWKTVQNQRYASLSFIVGINNEFYLINNHDFTITERNPKQVSSE